MELGKYMFTIFCNTTMEYWLKVGSCIKNTDGMKYKFVLDFTDVIDCLVTAGNILWLNVL